MQFNNIKLKPAESCIARGRTALQGPGCPWVRGREGGAIPGRNNKILLFSGASGAERLRAASAISGTIRPHDATSSAGLAPAQPHCRGQEVFAPILRRRKPGHKEQRDWGNVPQQEQTPGTSELSETPVTGLCFLFLLGEIKSTSWILPGSRRCVCARVCPCAPRSRIEPRANTREARAALLPGPRMLGAALRSLGYGIVSASAPSSPARLLVTFVPAGGFRLLQQGQNPTRSPGRGGLYNAQPKRATQPGWQAGGSSNGSAGERRPLRRESGQGCREAGALYLRSAARMQPPAAFVRLSKGAPRPHRGDLLQATGAKPGGVQSRIGPCCSRAEGRRPPPPSARSSDVRLGCPHQPLLPSPVRRPQAQEPALLLRRPALHKHPGLVQTNPHG